MKRIHAASPWKILYEKFDPHEEGLREALCTLGNGYFGTRGAAYESVASKIHYPGTYIASLYNRLATTIAGKTIINEDFVNCPNWLFLTFKIGDGEWVILSPTRILSYRQELDMHKGVLTRKIRLKNKKGQRTLIESSRIVSMADPHCAAFEYIITPENYSEWITVRTMLDGTVLNTGVERYRQLNSKHWKPSSLGGLGRNGVHLSMKTTQSKIETSLAARVRLFVADREKRFETRHLMKGKERIGQEFRFFARQGHSYSIEKTVSIYTSKDKNVKNPTTAAIEHVKRPQRFKALLKSHQQAWESLWEKHDIKIEGHNFSQRTLRLHIFHLLQTASIHNVGIDAGIPARGLHGEAYRGHIFWDEMFAMPLYCLHAPQISKALLLYRYRRLPKAREYANKKGYCGAMFPWQSGSSGREETQVIHLNPLSGKWGPDHSSLQRHVSFAIVYNVWRFWKRTNDFNFLIRYGAEIILSIAQFCSSLTKYDPKDGRFHTKGVMGPDEFHEKLPNSSKPGLKDNTYINLMVAWTLLKAKEIIDIIPHARKERILNRLRISHKELGRWEEITRKMRVIINDKGIMSQFEGYFNLKELDWEGYLEEYGNIERMDRILKAEGKYPDEYKVSKQADALMVFYLLELQEIKELFHRLGYHFDKKMLRKNYEYHIKRTSHGSTLSKVVHCYIAHLLNRPQEAWKWLFEVLKSDLYDTQGGTTPEGIHVGVMGGSVDIVIRGVAGISFLDDRLKIDPMLPKRWKRIKFKFLYKGRWISMSLTKNQVSIHIEGTKGQAFGLPIEINEKLHYLLLDKRYNISLKNKG
ncbi:MAG: glycoside hydrolase family 65 protein [Candidatus Omnitrophota bacterium]|nr:MAG: glycoside hydrolase family 65 protein [Candidatus Omnitrophota bacterium]